LFSSYENTLGGATLNWYIP